MCVSGYFISALSGGRVRIQERRICASQRCNQSLYDGMIQTQQRRMCWYKLSVEEAKGGRACRQNTARADERGEKLSESGESLIRDQMRVREFRCRIERKQMQNESRKQVASQCNCLRAGANRRLENTRTNLGASRTRSTQHIETVMVIFQSYSAVLGRHVEQVSADSCRQTKR